jgi:hypothetical protein
VSIAVVGVDASESYDHVVVLGGELAAARAAERRHVAPGASPIAGVAYSANDGEEWRWVECPCV